MVSSQSKFEDAAERVKKLSTKPGNETLLKLYSHYKQATVGDNETPKPGMFDFQGSAKWKAWDTLKGMSRADAEQKYVDLVEELESRT